MRFRLLLWLSLTALPAGSLAAATATCLSALATAAHATAALGAWGCHAVEAHIAGDRSIVISEIDRQFQHHRSAHDLATAKALRHLAQLGILCAIQGLLAIIQRGLHRSYDLFLAAIF